MEEPKPTEKQANATGMGRRCRIWLRPVPIALLVTAGAGAGIALAWPTLLDRQAMPNAAGAVLGDVVLAQATPAPDARVSPSPTPDRLESPADAPTPPAADEQNASSAFQAHARQAGIGTCADLYDGLGESLTAGARYDVRSTWSEASPDENPIEGLAGIVYEDEAYSATAAGYVFAAPGERSCSGAMVRVSPFPAPCSDLPGLIPAASRPVEDIESLRVYAQSDGGHVLLLPVGSGCAVISTLVRQDLQPIEGERE